MNLWCIKFHHPRGSAFLDYRTVSGTRRGAWEYHMQHYASSAPQWLAKMKRQRRKGEIRAVKVTLKELGNG